MALTDWIAEMGPFFACTIGRPLSVSCRRWSDVSWWLQPGQRLPHQLQLWLQLCKSFLSILREEIWIGSWGSTDGWIDWMGCRFSSVGGVGIGIGVVGAGSMARKNGLLIPMLCVNTYFGAQEVAGKQPVFPATSRKVKWHFPQQSESVEIR